MKEAKQTLQRDTARKLNSHSLPYREIAPAWIARIVMAEKLLDAVGFIIKTTISNKTILVYPHWNEDDCLGKVHSLLKLISGNPELAALCTWVQYLCKHFVSV